jgi:serine phosphatase RsbU (regulator of sigma subunit)
MNGAALLDELLARLERFTSQRPMADDWTLLTLQHVQ